MPGVSQADSRPPRCQTRPRADARSGSTSPRPRIRSCCGRSSSACALAATRSRSPRATTRRRSRSAGMHGPRRRRVRRARRRRRAPASSARSLSRTRALQRWARAAASTSPSAHGSNDLALAARSLGIPAVNTFDYEWATLQHNIGCRLRAARAGPRRDPARAAARATASARRQARAVPGAQGGVLPLRTSSPTRTCSPRLGVDRARVIVIVRPPPDVSLYHRKSNPLFPQVLQHLGSDDGVHAVVLPRTDGAARVRARARPAVADRARRRRRRPERRSRSPTSWSPPAAR